MCEAANRHPNRPRTAADRSCPITADRSPQAAIVPPTLRPSQQHAREQYAPNVRITKSSDAAAAHICSRNRARDNSRIAPPFCPFPAFTSPHASSLRRTTVGAFRTPQLIRLGGAQRRLCCHHGRHSSRAASRTERRRAHSRTPPRSERRHRHARHDRARHRRSARMGRRRSGVRIIDTSAAA